MKHKRIKVPILKEITNGTLMKLMIQIKLCYLHLSLLVLARYRSLLLGLGVHTKVKLSRTPFPSGSCS